MGTFRKSDAAVKAAQKEIDRLDRIGRERALTDQESLLLERNIRIVDGFHKRERRPVNLRPQFSIGDVVRFNAFNGGVKMVEGEIRGFRPRCQNTSKPDGFADVLCNDGKRRSVPRGRLTLVRHADV